jgi:hypothetical protein
MFSMPSLSTTLTAMVFIKPLYGGFEIVYHVASDKADKVNALRFHCFEYFEVVAEYEFIDGHGCSLLI